MDEKTSEVLKQYEITVINRFRARGAILLETDKGFKLFQELEGSLRHLPVEYQVKEILRENGLAYVDQIIKTKEGELYSQDEQEQKYIVKDWYRFPECDLQNMEQLATASKSLAKLHNALECTPIQLIEGKNADLQEILSKRTRELKRVHNYIKERTGKNAFEICIVNAFPQFYEQAKKAETALAESDFQIWLQKTQEKGSICHGDFNQHHVLLNNRNCAVTNFEKCHIALQITDVYQFLRKAMEKNHWEVSVGEKILESYDSVRYIKKEDAKILEILLTYPEKYWKIVNCYYNNRKSWVSDYNMKKLVKICKQEEEKQKFLFRLQSFHM